LFLAGGWLLAVGEAGVEESSLIRSKIVAPPDWSAEFPAYPRILEPLAVRGRLLCGSAAVAFDPLCGDGTGNAVREAILASAVVRAALRGLDIDALLDHYRRRLIAALGKHLEICAEFYQTGGDTPWWHSELALIREGIAWCAEESAGAARFRLNGW